MFPFSFLKKFIIYYLCVGGGTYYSAHMETREQCYDIYSLLITFHGTQD